MMNRMKSLWLICIVVLAFSGSAYGAAGWTTSYAKALEASKETGKPILANFTGSDWCGYCIRLHKQVFKKSEFRSWAKKNVILLELDYPKGKRLSPKLRQQNSELARRYKVSGYPTLMMLDSEGETLFRPRASIRGAKNWVDQVRTAVEVHRILNASEDADSGKTIVHEGFPKIENKISGARQDLRGKRMPELAFGKWMTKEPSLKGKVVVINFMLPNYGSSQKFVSMMNSFQKKFGSDVSIVGLFDKSKKSEISEITDFMKQYKPKFGIAIDPLRRLYNGLGVHQLPNTVVIGSDGVVRWQGFVWDKNGPLTEEVLGLIVKADKAAKALRGPEEERVVSGKKKKRKRVMRVSSKSEAVNEVCFVDGETLGEKAVKARYDKKTYGVCSSKCYSKFKKDPKKHLVNLK